MDAILSKCLQGHGGAWDEFVEKYVPVILGAVRRLLLTRGLARQQDLAEDIVQDVFLRLIKDDYHLLRTYDPARAGLATWLNIVARSTAIDRLRRKRLAEVPLDQAPVLAAPAESAHNSTPTEDLLRGLLTPRQKLLLHLLFDRQMDFAEIAKLLGISQQTVRSTKFKAIQRLREYFSGKDSL